jgi:NitT/TauT family transport system substrate-binding protein
MKRSALGVALLVTVLGLSGCAQSPTAPQSASPTETTSGAPSVPIRLAGLTGPTTMGMVKLLQDNDAGATSQKYEFTVAGSADEITPKLVQGDLDIAAVPANLASVLYNNTSGQIQMLAVNTLGVLYIVDQGNNVSTLKDLKGKTVYATGKGSTPEYTLRYLLSANGLNPDSDVSIEWKSEPTEVVALLQSDPGAIAMLPQPYVTAAQTQLPNLRIAVDLTKAWDELDTGSTLITGTLVVRKDFAAEHPDQITEFLDEYQKSTQWVNDNPADAAPLVEQYVGVKAPIAQKAIPYCNITFIAGAEMKSTVTGYLQVLFDANPKSIGGTLPGDDFFYAT